ncbi:MAG: OmpH family outer membrane protein [Syntrophotaleaceae bacterium]
MKRLWIGLVVLLVMVASPVVAAEVKIAFVDMRIAMSECDAGKAATANIQKKAKGLQDNLQQRQQSLTSLKEELEKKKLMLSDDAKAEKEREFLQQQKDLQRFVKDGQDELQREGQRLTNSVIEGLVKVIKDLGDKEGYTLVLERSNGVLYADDAIDVTDKVVAAYNKAYKAK